MGQRVKLKLRDGLPLSSAFQLLAATGYYPSHDLALEGGEMLC